MSAVIRGVDFGAAWSASGARGGFGEGYWFHRFVPGLSWKGSTFVSKTTTLEAREGNMPLKDDWTPRSLHPRCVVVYPWEGHVLNAVGLSGPGAKALFETGHWQEWPDPFFLSFMAVGESREDRLDEAEEFSVLMRSHLDWFEAPVGLQVNLSCPNTAHDPGDLADEAAALLGCIRKNLPVTPLIAKVNALLPFESAVQLQGHCDGICVSNTIPWGSTILWASRADQIPWNALCNSSKSPLKHLGGGGLSGAPLLPVVSKWIAGARRAGLTKHVNACGGIMRPLDVRLMAVGAGADSVSLGTIAMLRGWRLRKTIKKARELLA